MPVRTDEVFVREVLWNKASLDEVVLLALLHSLDDPEVFIFRSVSVNDYWFNVVVEFCDVYNRSRVLPDVKLLELGHFLLFVVNFNVRHEAGVAHVDLLEVLLIH